MNIVYYGGSFDPIHVGHMIVAQAAINQGYADHVVFVPTFAQPFKTHIASFEDRAEMIQRTITHSGDCTQMSVSRVEMKVSKGGPVTTFELASHLGEETRPSFLIGSDSLESMPNWHKSDKLASIARFLVAIRPGAYMTKAMKSFCEKYEEDTFKLFVPPAINVSSSGIRSLIAEGGNPSFCIPDPANEYILLNNLYGLDRDNLKS
jgi:nicotinate-nucleotide adenylyltransferase